jgi:UDP-N-acetyl-D-galactosamine dehydrogenase
LRSYHAQVDVHDPWADAEECRCEYGIDLCKQSEAGRYDAVLIAVGHQQVAAVGADGIRAW